MRLLVLSPNPMIRAGTSALLARGGLPQPVEELDAPELVSAALRRAAVDVAVVDIRQERPGVNGYCVARLITDTTAGATKVVLLSHEQQDIDVAAALRSGASGVVPHHSAADSLVAALHSVHHGGLYLDPLALSAVFTAPAAAPAPAQAPLTRREDEVLHLAGQGRSNREIAAALVVSEGTVKSHVHRIMGKLGSETRAQLVAYCYEHGLVRPSAAPTAPGCPAYADQRP
ncbi:response regulator transcription factor [Nocardiopsis sp. HNM0947]|uniref:Response regulator transcription factor n=1 Tax=Nocardiopsis coralli TaxID=2772213 RepID=A0ABR9P6T0_9ACTN|nr:response regulator transcription factor [Nocardiopsis coralli]MBE2999547.1 response regulator transcription factor [Nocardiopsis coralli]